MKISEIVKKHAPETVSALPLLNMVGTMKIEGAIIRIMKFHKCSRQEAIQRLITVLEEES